MNHKELLGNTFKTYIRIKLENLEEIDKFLYLWLKRVRFTNQYQFNKIYPNKNNGQAINMIEAIIQSSLKKKNSRERQIHYQIILSTNCNVKQGKNAVKSIL